MHTVLNFLEMDKSKNEKYPRKYPRTIHILMPEKLHSIILVQQAKYTIQMKRKPSMRETITKMLTEYAEQNEDK